ncbi:T9SS-dependent M36 family metallopeptidase [Pontibacter rugosus]
MVLEHLKQNKQKLEITESDISELAVTNESITRHNGMKHIYLQQMHEGIEVHGAITNVNMTKDNKVVSVGNRFQKALERKVKTTEPGLSPESAVMAAAKHLNLSVSGPLTVQSRGNQSNREVVLSNGGISLDPIPARLVYQPMEDGSLKLAWEVTIYELDALNWWNVRVDASTGTVLDKDNMVTHCEFDNHGPEGVALTRGKKHVLAPRPAPAPYNSVAAMPAAPTSNAYKVFAIPTESPSHGPRVYVSTSAADEVASPYGWHTTLSTPSVEYTITRGNNVHAYEDPNNNNNGAINYSPDGGPELLFDFPIDFTKQPVEYRDAAITNLFYMNNIMHDVWYKYGFDELSGNFQVNNYDRGGLGGDDVRAEAQDSRNITATRNNANFSTPRDGQRPRMQMYLWSGKADEEMFRVTSPQSIAGSYPVLEAAFSKPLTPTPVTGKLVVADGQEGCAALANAEAIAGNIAVMYRGGCPFADKVQFAQAAGAIAVLVINNAPGSPIVMGGTPTEEINIPAVMISQEDGQIIRAVLDQGQEVTVALKNSGSSPEVDGDFDNGIIAHEYGHGISNRLTGGPAATGCLSNAEQAGEGWSDWFGLMLTMEPGDKPGDVRGIGTYAQNQPTTGQGIRPAPYSTDFGVNSYTYAATNNTTLSQPHGVGFVWATMLWDMTWAMVDKYGWDADLYNGKGGNNMAMQLVIDGLKLQPCSPGFVDARDAILAADMQNYGGANQELIWRVFARRGLGFSASQGLSTSRTDQVEAFDLPLIYACDAPTITVKPTNEIFTGGDPTVIYLGFGPQSVILQASGSDSYSWSAVEGLNNTKVAAPIFRPRTAGEYTITVTGTNSFGCTKTATVTIKVVDIRCGDRNTMVMICKDGQSQCVRPGIALLALRDGAKLGSCDMSVTSTSAAVALEANGFGRGELRAVPNPVDSRTSIQFAVPQGGKYRVELIDMKGSLVSVLAEGDSAIGENHAIELNRGKMTRGMYLVRLITDNEVKTTKVSVR